MDIADVKSNLTKKIKYLGLNLDKIPDNLKEYEGLDYRPSRNYDEKSYKTYRYLDIKDINILLTPKNRLEDINIKYRKAAPISAYLDPEKETEIELHVKFLEMLNKVELEDIEQVEKEQKVLNERIPYAVKYNKDYLWQIHYADYTKKYFMLVPTEDQDHSAFFCLLKKQLKDNKKLKEKIFVPICYSEYSNEYLKKSEIEELEKYMWYFTKKWPLICEVYDQNDNLSLFVTGESVVYEDIISSYSVKLNNKEDAIKFYKLAKALFILQTELPHYYKFNVKLDKSGGIEFYFKEQKIAYEEFQDFIKQEYLRLENEDKNNQKEKKKLEKKLNEIKLESAKLDLEYLSKEKEITVYLECKKTFLGKVRYFFTKKKTSNDEKTDVKKEKASKEKPEENKEEQEKTKDISKKEFYTLEDLIERYKELEQDTGNVKNMRLDIEAGEYRNKNLQLKVKNATLFLDEIENHTKSIFEFWKFANKDKIMELQEGSAEEQKMKLKKTFNYELDMEDFAKDIDREQRAKLSKEEINSVFIATTELIADINKVANKGEITKERIEELKKQLLEDRKLLADENFDIFGSVSSDKTVINKLANKKHREIKKDKFKILEINRNTDNKQYQEYLGKIIDNLCSGLQKISLGIGLPIYCTTTKKEIDKYFNVFDINSANVSQKIEELKEDKDITIYRINLKEKTEAIALTNIIYYDNANQTLPLGMDETERVLIDKSVLELELKNKQEIRVACYKDVKDEFSDVIIKTINVEEYDVK